MSDYHQYITMLAMQKLAGWAFAVGERPRLPAELTGRRPHRGQLPDVDFDRATFDPNYRPLWSRIADMLFGRRHRPALPTDIEADLRAGLTAAVGERLAAAYIGEDETDSAASRETDGKTDPTHLSRAA